MTKNLFNRFTIISGLVLALLIGTTSLKAEDVNLTPTNTIRFVVRVPESTPKGAAIDISGSLEELGMWNSGLELQQDVDGLYRGSITTAATGKMEFKVRRGGWANVEKNSNGEEIANRSAIIHDNTTINISVEAWADEFALAQSDKPSTVVGELIIHKDVKSEYLELSRTVRVYLPPNYEQNKDAHYPVLYMHDGQNLFDQRTSAFGNEWEVDENLVELVKAKKMEPIIVVGIDNSAMRSDEYTPTYWERYGAGGKGDAYAKFLITELKPFIDKTYRTKPEAQYTGTAGSSLGGLISLYLGTAYPDTFTRIGSVSPALGWDNNQIIRDFSEYKKTYLPHWQKMRNWIDMGTLEGDTGGGGVCTVPLAEEVAQIFRNSNLRENDQFKLFIAENGLHNEPAWAKRIDKILMYLYPPTTANLQSVDQSQ
ncbi:Endo-1,4-beta-xylanase Z precursor [Poriferisphaera corsica]|uniref:Endo-1,4-beta-xylanase Z n=1 Tax=Poriferisphaera corsica TaxID=2528020 RepID=A0A517YWM2_9BACT|nr:alpha/beta hydrolase-fold protein [Poriferisphaera corsica]QDU34631.1 Endo-1,4-beta-xylanase Z precursor [Poriferisphaera corsica]